MSKRNIDEADDSGLEAQEDIVNVDFDFFDVSDDDYLSIKHLLRQLFGPDNVKIDIGALAELAIGDGTGLTIKTDGKDSDPFAVISAVDYKKAKEDFKHMHDLTEYWIKRTSEADEPELNRLLRKLFSSKSEEKCAILLSERLLNMPHQIVQPLYHLLADELASKGTGYDYLIIPSKVYTEEESQLDAEHKRPAKKGPTSTELFYFHPEDEIFQQLAAAHGAFPFETAMNESDSRRVFQEHGILPKGYLTILRYIDLPRAIESLKVLNE